MTNVDRASELFAEAAAVLQEARGAAAGGRNNLALRRAQEVIELAEKAVLLWSGRAYPKNHDVGEAVVAALANQRKQLDTEFADWLMATSTDLARKRAPAFYGEAHFDAEDAAEAVAAAERIYAWAQGVMK